MTFKCSGELHCENSAEAKLTIYFEEKKQDEFKVKQLPICVEENQVNTSIDIKVFRFWSEEFDHDSNEINIIFEHYACGYNATYDSSNELANNGAYLIVDEEIQNDASYYYWSGFDEGRNKTYYRYLEEVDKIPETSEGSLTVNDKNCILEGCEIIVYDKDGKQLYQNTGKSPCNVEIACDDDCPKGYLKCESNKYPGYCCLPCKDTASKIRDLGNKL
ncbi:hypothetical protein Riv7116_1846 [Rivularia sp. PCC 7116]|uniref:hypothetical protein n=1 Tax=Rivularia sp. PCC 7116 TaxID=373994 RepID=UPI00029EE3F3|nr:hypothetical protein [Rivularia sp. PCC 7116]AFY54387.1 hypothetical protein Riv7116_1846 [Rivularia sp. PCC 7116]